MIDHEDHHDAAIWKAGPHRELSLDRPWLMGILNVTPDSFSDGGLFYKPARAVGRALRMINEGAAIIDVGGESTRPGAQRVGDSEQIDRTAPVIEELRRHADVIISIDTTRSTVAEAALEAGAHVINDVSAGREDGAMLPLAAARGCGIVLMHRLRPPPADSYSDRYDVAPAYGDVVHDVAGFLRERAEAAIAAGVEHDAIVLDPGLGFGKTVEQNFELIARTGELVELGYPVLSGASRKSFIGKASGVETPAQRLSGSIAVSVAHWLAGVRLFRVHDVAAHAQALAVARAIAPRAASWPTIS